MQTIFYKSTVLGAVALALSFAVLRCSNADLQANRDMATIAAENKLAASSDSNKNSEKVEIPISVEAGGSSLNLAGEGDGLALAEAVSSYSMTLSGCASGLTATIDQSVSSVSVFTFDTGCVVKLVSFTRPDGQLYTLKTGAGTWTTGATGAANIFSNHSTDPAVPSVEVTVTVNSQLSNPVLPTDAVKFTYNESKALGNVAVDKNSLFSAPTAQILGVQAPRFHIPIGGVTLGSSVANKVTITMKLECDVVLLGAPGSEACGDDNLADLKYKVVQDTVVAATATVPMHYTYNGVLTMAQAVSIFAAAPAGGVGVDSVLAADASLPFDGGASISKSGITFATIQSTTLPAQFIYIVKNLSGSYSYFVVHF